MKTKAILFVVLTLIIGFFLGILTSSQIRHSKMKQMRYYVSGRDFSEMMMEVIQPDDKQRAELKKVMNRFHDDTHILQSAFRKDYDSLSVAFKKEIDTLLTPEQLERVRRSENQRREMMNKKRSRPEDHYKTDRRESSRAHHDNPDRPDEGRGY